MGRGFDNLWADLPENVDHPYRVAIIEAFRWIGEPLSAVQVVDVVDGCMSMWNAVAHMEALERLGVVEAALGERGTTGHGESFDMSYRLIDLGAGEDG